MISLLKFIIAQGFNIEERVRLYQAELTIAFYRRKGPVTLHEVERTIRMASVRIHVERVIGLILRKPRISEGIIPEGFIKLKSGDSSVPTVDNKSQKGYPLETKNTQNHENRRLDLIESLHM